MTAEIEDIAEKALMLSPSARAYLAEMLLESIDYEEDFLISDEWMAEILKRCHEIDHSEVELIPGEDAFGLSSERIFMKPYRFHPQALKEADDAAAF